MSPSGDVPIHGEFAVYSNLFPMGWWGGSDRYQVPIDLRGLLPLQQLDAHGIDRLLTTLQDSGAPDSLLGALTAEQQRLQGQTAEISGRLRQLCAPTA